MIKSFGKITVATAGTPVRVTATSFPCNKIIIVPLSANTGNIIPGDSTLVTATLVGAYHDGLAAGQEEAISAQGTGNILDVALLYLDASVNGEGAVVYAIAY